MTKVIDAGLFIPVGNHGWIHSMNSPAVEDGSFRRVLEVTKTAEALGFDAKVFADPESAVAWLKR